jgi:uncharacterized DUF497 family protein
MKFEWDVDKDVVNQKKHGISFSSALLIFSDKFILTQFDTEHSDSEDRYISIGNIPIVNTLVVIHTER